LIPADHRSLSISTSLEGELPQVRASLEKLSLPGLIARPLDGVGPALVIAATDDEPVPLNRSLSAAPRVTNSNKVLFPRDGFTKDDLASWYREVAPMLLTHMEGRPIVAQRWPDGIDDFTWFQHRVPPKAPDYLKSVRIEGDRRILIESEDALLWMVNQAALTFHGWASRVAKLNEPDWAIIDLDPGPKTTWPQLIEVSLAVRALLELLEVPSVVKTSGQKGLHILVPLAAGHSTAQCFEFAERVCKMVAQLKPEQVSLVAETGPRAGRLYLDCVQNFTGKTLVLPYSVRAVDGAPVSTPLTWDEVTPTLDPKRFTLKTMGKRLDEKGDLFASALHGTLQLAPVLERLRAGK
jgi:bifunctional non-homologous end joining protein LigD